MWQLFHVYYAFVCKIRSQDSFLNLEESLNWCYMLNSDNVLKYNIFISPSTFKSIKPYHAYFGSAIGLNLLVMPSV